MRKGIRGIIWSYDFDTALECFEKIERQYMQFEYAKVVKKRISTTGTFIQFNNGDYWKICPARESSRGHRANISYIDRRISKEIIDNLIRPQTICPPFIAFNYYGPYPEEKDKGG